MMQWNTTKVAIGLALSVLLLAGLTTAQETNTRWQKSVVGLNTVSQVISERSTDEQLAVRSTSLEERVQRLEDAALVSGKTFRAYWDHGVRFQTLDKDIDITLGGRVQLDWNWSRFDDELDTAFGDAEARIFFRRARLKIGGTLYKYIAFKAAFDFANGDVDLKDVYMRFQQLPYLGSLTVGKFTVPFSLEQETSSLFITFQERSLTSAFVPGHEMGFLFHDVVLDARMTWAVAGTRETDNGSTLSTAGAGNDWNAAVRLTGLPWYQDNGTRLVHLGFAYAFRNYADNSTSYNTNPEAEIEDTDGTTITFVDTASFDAKWGSQIGAEGALVYGPLSVQGEYMLVFGLEGADSVTADDVEDATFYAWYAMASYFLTGEHRPYNRSSGAFGRPIPRHNFLQNGAGAWEVGVRVSGIDLQDAQDFNGPTAGGKELNMTFGVNWYPNPNARVTLNYVTGWVDDRTLHGVSLDDNRFDIFMMRFQVDF